MVERTAIKSNNSTWHIDDKVDGCGWSVPMNPDNYDDHDVKSINLNLDREEIENELAPGSLCDKGCNWPE